MESSSMSTLATTGSDLSLAIDTIEQQPLAANSPLPVDLFFCDISCDISTGQCNLGSSPSLFACGVQRRGKRTLNHINGQVLAGRLLAVLGPSGSGKTTLMDTLAGRKRTGDISGRIYLNQKQASFDDLCDLAGYVTQDDALLPTFTVLETLTFAAHLRLPYKQYSTKEKAKMVEKIIEDLRLSEVRHSRIGGQFIRGISGGERRRLCIGIELLMEPSLLFLDEPTSGLDSNSALLVVEVLKNLATSRKTAIMCTLHQPRSSIMQIFDDLLVLTKGHLIYQGPAANAVHYFHDIGFPCPIGWNVADHILDIVSSAAQQTNMPLSKLSKSDDPIQSALSIPDHIQVIALSSVSKESAFCEHLADTFAGSPVGIELLAALAQVEASANRPTPYSAFLGYTAAPSSATPSTISTAAISPRSSFPSSAVSKQRRRRLPFLNQLFLLWQRNTKHTLRHPLIATQQICGYLLCAVLIGLLFSNLQTQRFEQMTIGLTFMTDVYAVFTFFAIPTFIQNRAIVNRETTARYYSPTAYFVANLLCTIPFFSLLSLAYVCIIAKLQHWQGDLGFAILLGNLSLQCFLALNELFGALFNSIDLALAIAGFVNLLAMVFDGVLALYPNIPSYLRFLYWSSPLSYAVAASIDNEFSTTAEGLYAMQVMGNPLFGHRWTCIFALLGFTSAFRLGSLLALQFLHKEKR